MERIQVGADLNQIFAGLNWIWTKLAGWARLKADRVLRCATKNCFRSGFTSTNVVSK